MNNSDIFHNSPVGLDQDTLNGRPDADLSDPQQGVEQECQFSPGTTPRQPSNDSNPFRQARRNPFDFPTYNLLQAQKTVGAAPVLGIGTGNGKSPPSNGLDPFDPLDFGDPTFVSSFSSPPAFSSFSRQNPAYNSLSTSPLSSVANLSQLPTTRFLDSKASIIKSSTPSFVFGPTVPCVSAIRPTVPSVSAISPNFHRSKSHPAFPSISRPSGFPQRTDTDTHFITSFPPISQASHFDHAQASKSALAFSGYTAPSAGRMGAYFDKSHEIFKSPDLIIKDYTFNSDNTREGAGLSSFDEQASSTRFSVPGYQSTSGFIVSSGGNRIIRKEGEFTHSIIEDPYPNFGKDFGADFIMGDESRRLFHQSGERGEISKFTNSQMQEGMILSKSTRLGSGKYLNREREKSDVYSQKVYAEGSEWEEIDDGLEDSPLLDSREHDRRALVKRDGRASGRNPAFVGDTSATDRHGASSQHLFHSSSVGFTDPNLTRTSAKETCIQAQHLTPSCDSLSIRGGMSRNNDRFRRRSSLGELSPLPSFMENQHSDRNGDIYAYTYRHCHKRRVTSLTDKLARRQLLAVVVLCVFFMVGEGVGGALANSLALFTDVLHLGSDLISFIISLLALWLANKPATRRMSFGYHRAEVLGALISVFIIWLVSGVLCYIAVDRIRHEHYTDVKPDEMLITASLGVLFNIIMGLVLHSEMCCGHAHSHNKFGHSHGGHGHSHGHGGHGHSHGNGHSQGRKNSQDVVACAGKQDEMLNGCREDFEYKSLESPTDFSSADQQLRAVNAMTVISANDDSNSSSEEQHICGTSDDDEAHHKQKNINVRAAFIHVIGDILQSLGVLVAALIIKFTTDERFRLADPICTFLFSLLVLVTTITVLRDTLLVIMEGVPRDVSSESLKKELLSIDGVIMVHSLHIWALTLDRNALSVHLAIDSSQVHERVLSSATKLIQDRHHFFHSTIQVELYDDEVMRSCKDCMEFN